MISLLLFLYYAIKCTSAVKMLIITKVEVYYIIVPIQTCYLNNKKILVK